MHQENFYSLHVIPTVDLGLFEFDAKDILNVRIDRKRKLPATTFMMALPDVESEAYMEACAEKSQEVDPARVNGMSREEILSNFTNRDLQPQRRWLAI